MSKDKQELVPRLRFPEFRETGGWRIRPLNDLLQEARTRNRDGLYGPEQVLSVSGEYGCVNQIELLGRSYAGVSVKEYHIVESGYVVYTKSPLKRNPFGIIKANKGAPGIVSTLYAVYRPTDEGFAEFIDFYFGSDFRLNSYLQPIVRKGAKNDMKVNNSAVLTGPICAPSVPEQKRVSACLSSLDDLIAAETKALDTLKVYKKGLMQQLFPQEGETVPRLRFPEFRGSGEWREVPLEEVCERIMDGTHFSPGSKSGPFLYLTSKNIRDGYLALDDVNYISEEEHRSIFQRCPVRKGDLLLTKDGAGTGACTLNTLDVEFSLLSSVAVIRGVESKVLQQFLIQDFFSDHMQAQISGGTAGQAITRITLEKIKRFNVWIADVAEQGRIASFLSSLDLRVAAQVQKIDALKTHKKGLVQGLFPTINGDAD